MSCGWSAHQPSLPGVRTLAGDAALPAALADAQVVVNLLPLTPATRGLLDARLFALLPRGASVVNLARGAHLVEADLLGALASGHLRHAVLDVFATRAAARGAPVLVAPAGDRAAACGRADRPAQRGACWLPPTCGAARGRPLQHLVDRARGY